MEIKLTQRGQENLVKILRGYIAANIGRLATEENSRTFQAAERYLEQFTGRQIPTTPLIVTITGPSLSGKTTLARALVKTGFFKELVSHTTRSPRANEVHGLDYYFVQPSVFEEIEFAEKVEFNGALYGLSVSEIERGFDSGKIPLVVVEPNGCAQIAEVARRKGWNHFKIFVTNPTTVRIKRFIERFLKEPDAQAAAPKYMARLQAMLTEEESWESARDDWDLRFGRYCPLTEESVHLEILEALGLRGSSSQFDSSVREVVLD